MYSFLTTQSKFSTTLNNTVLLTFEASKQCNVFCPNCYIPEEKRLKDKNLFDIEWLDKLKNSQNLKNAESFRITLYGGELSILDKDYIENFISRIKSIFPTCSFTIVTNLYNLKPSFVELYHKYSDILETTFDFARVTMNKNRDVFLDKYKEGFEKIANSSLQSNLQMDIAFRVNQETVDFGIDNIISYFSSFNLPKNSRVNLLLEHAIDFQHFRSQGQYDLLSGYPIMKTEISYDTFGKFVYDLKKNEKKLNDIGFYPIQTMDFNSGIGGFILSFASTGDVTVNPLFTDIPSAFIGNIGTQELDEMLNNTKFKLLKNYEKKRIYKCAGCDSFDNCMGGPLFLPKDDPFGTQECAGIKSYIQLINAIN